MIERDASVAKAPRRFARMSTTAVGSLAAALLLGACGQKGPLYLPRPSKAPVAAPAEPASAPNR